MTVESKERVEYVRPGKKQDLRKFTHNEKVKSVCPFIYQFVHSFPED
jgi:hypothetical protein